MAAANSLAVFRAHINVRMDGTLDAESIVSRESYLAWLGLRNAPESLHEARRFQRTLSNHIAGSDGRSPFTPAEEAAVLLVVRRKERWPCFPASVNIGHTGYRSKGFHEKSFNQFKQPIAGLSGGKFQDKEFVANMAHKLQGMVNSADQVDLSLYVQLGNLLRFVVLARTPVCSLSQATSDVAQRLCREVSEQYAEHDAIIIMDLTARDYTQGLVLAQNEASMEHFGNLFERQTRHLPFHGGDTYKVISAVCSAFHQPGVQFPAGNVRYNFAGGRGGGGGGGEEEKGDDDGPLLSAAGYRSQFEVDEQTYLLVFRGVVVDDEDDDEEEEGGGD